MASGTTLRTSTNPAARAASLTGGTSGLACAVAAPETATKPTATAIGRTGRIRRIWSLSRFGEPDQMSHTSHRKLRSAWIARDVAVDVALQVGRHRRHHLVVGHRRDRLDLPDIPQQREPDQLAGDQAAADAAARPRRPPGWIHRSGRAPRSAAASRGSWSRGLRSAPPPAGRDRRPRRSRRPARCGSVACRDRPLAWPRSW